MTLLGYGGKGESLVTPSNDAGVETAVIVSSVPACPYYAGPLFD
jgi:hypothetical protein